jgi:hypothetical protein
LRGVVGSHALDFLEQRAYRGLAAGIPRREPDSHVTHIGLDVTISAKARADASRDDKTVREGTLNAPLVPIDPEHHEYFHVFHTISIVINS